MKGFLGTNDCIEVDDSHSTTLSSLMIYILEN
jgi:hypothetical protein